MTADGGQVRTLGLAGTGLIGAGWAARAMFAGIDVIAYDPSSDAEQVMRAAVDTAWPSMVAHRGGEPDKAGVLSFTTSLTEMAGAADFIQEAAPEREDLKIALFGQLDKAAPDDVILASSSSGFLPSRLQSDCTHPERVIIGHPFNPVYLLPLVETVGGAATAPEALDRAGMFYERLGMKVLRLKKEIEGYVCDRLQEALWREALHILNKGIATTGEIDDALVYSAGLRWALMGPFLTYHLAGGEGGMAAFMAQFDPSLDLPWTDLKFPRWSDELSGRLIDGCEAQAGGRSVREMEAKRNAVLVDILAVLKKHGIGAGSVALPGTV